MKTIHFPIHSSRVVALSVGSAFLALAGASSLSAQVIDGRWQPWIGCWSAVSSADRAEISLSGRETQRLVCVSPAATQNPAEVVVTSIANGKVLSRESIDASGARVNKTVDECPGWETAQWSADGHRLMLKSEFVCSGNVTRKESGVLSMTSPGEWLDVQGFDIMGNTEVRVARFADARISLAEATSGVLQGAEAVRQGSSARLDSALLGVKSQGNFALQTLRAASASPISASDVVEVSEHVGAPVAEAWVTETGQGFDLDAKSLVKLADNGMSPRMIDLMVALSYPKTFVVDKSTPQPVNDRGRVQDTRRTGSDLASNRGYDSCNRFKDLSYGTSPYSRRAINEYCYRTNHYDPFFSSLYGNFGYGYSYGYGNGYGYGYGNYYYGQQPIVIVTRPGSGGNDGSASVRGRAVNGQGYTRGDALGGTSQNSSIRRGSAGSSSGASAGSTGGSTGSAGGASAGSGAGTSTGRAAKPRGSGSNK